MARGGRISTGTTGGQSFAVDVQIEGVAKASDEFKRIRGSINSHLRDAMVRVGEQTLLPALKAGMPTVWGETLFVKRDRAGVFIGSRLRGSMNRALGWWDFGGRRPRDTVRRHGPHVIVLGLQQQRPSIDRAITQELKQAFSYFETDFR